jgi:hypothetical protein
MLGRAMKRSGMTSLCPSCHQKRVVEFGETLYEEVLKQVPHRQWVFSIPKRLRVYFMYDRKLLGKLSQCAGWSFRYASLHFIARPCIPGRYYQTT